jgi:hypothetical protein
MNASNPPPLPAGHQPKTSGLAIASLLLGLVGFLIITALGGLVCGIVALSRIKRSGGALKGQGLAIAGMALSAIMLAMLPILAILAGMLLPALAKAKEKAQSISCVNNLKNLGLGMRIFAGDHNDRFPLSWQGASNEISRFEFLICPADGNHHPAQSWADLTPANISYEFRAQGADASDPSRVLIQCPIHGHLLLADGSVQVGYQRRFRPDAPPAPTRAREPK